MIVLTLLSGVFLFFAKCMQRFRDGLSLLTFIGPDSYFVVILVWHKSMKLLLFIALSCIDGTISNQ